MLAQPLNHTFLPPIGCYNRSMMHLLSVRQIADRTGVPYGSIKSLVSRRLSGADNGFPAPDVAIGETTDAGRGLTYGWSPDAIDRWREGYRPGHSRARKSDPE